MLGYPNPVAYPYSIPIVRLFPDHPSPPSPHVNLHLEGGRSCRVRWGSPLDMLCVFVHLVQCKNPMCITFLRVLSIIIYHSIGRSVVASCYLSFWCCLVFIFSFVMYPVAAVHCFLFRCYLGTFAVVPGCRTWVLFLVPTDRCMIQLYRIRL